MKLLKLFPSPHVPDRWLAELEEGETLRLDTGAVAALGLRPGQALGEAELEALREAAALYAAQERALRLLSARQMSRAELERKLREKGASPAAIPATLERMERLGAINDAEYAGAVVRMCLRKGFGPQRVRAELIRRGVPRDCWEEALGALPEENGDTLDALLDKRLSPDPSREELQKAAAWLQRRGYPWREIKAAIERRREETLDDE